MGQVNQVTSTHARSASATGEDRVTGWVGWIAFASFMMMIGGVFQSISGLIAVFNDSWYVVDTGQLIVFQSVAAWGWAHLLVGLLLFFAGLSLIGGAMWARVLAVTIAALSAIAYFLAIPLYPVWSIIGLVVSILVVYAVMVHGGEVKAARGE